MARRTPHADIRLDLAAASLGARIVRGASGAFAALPQTATDIEDWEARSARLHAHTEILTVEPKPEININTRHKVKLVRG